VDPGVECKARGSGALLFHYNYPYCDVAMEINEEYRRRGLGAYLVQELKRIAYEMGGIPSSALRSEQRRFEKTLQKSWVGSVCTYSGWEIVIA